MKKFIKLTAWLACLFFAQAALAQVGINTESPDASAALHVESTTQGVLAPRMTQAQRDAISSPANGLLIYQTDGMAGFYYCDNGTWKELSNKHVTNYQIYKTPADWGTGYGFSNSDNRKIIPFSDVFIDGSWHAVDGKCQYNFVAKVTNRSGNCYIYLYKDGAEIWALNMSSDLAQSGWQDITFTGLSTFHVRVGNSDGGGNLENVQLLIRPK